MNMMRSWITNTKMLCKEDDISDDKKRKNGQRWFFFYYSRFRGSERLVPNTMYQIQECNNLISCVFRLQSNRKKIVDTWHVLKKCISMEEFFTGKYTSRFLYEDEEQNIIFNMSCDPGNQWCCSITDSSLPQLLHHKSWLNEREGLTAFKATR